VNQGAVIKTFQKFAFAHASIHNHFNLECKLTSHETFKQNRAKALAVWREIAA
jgi:putative transposase